jgi:hypothetical protein
MKPAKPMLRGCCGTRTYPDEASAARSLAKITVLRSGDGGMATWSAATEARQCRNGKWHLHEPAEETGFSAAVKAQVRARAQMCCEACGIWLGEHGGQVQHILARGSGGSKDPVIDSIVNAAMLCGTPMTGCHGLCEARDRRMHKEGFWLQRGQDPAAEPFLWHAPGDGSGLLKWRTADGGYSDAPPLRAAA